MTGDRVTSFRSDGWTFDVRDEGPRRAPAVIALHGFPQTSASWSAVTPRLTAAGYRVLAPDQRGYSPGARPRAVSAYTLDRLCGDVLALADAAGLARFSLLGHDWGAVVGWALAAAVPQRVRSLSAVSVGHPVALRRAVLGTQALRSSYMAFFQLPELPERVLGSRDGATARRLLVRSGHPDPEPAVRLLTDRRTATGALNWYRALRQPPGLRVGPVSVPTLYVWSDADAALGRRAAERTRAWVRGPYRFEVLSGVNHWIPETRPVELTQLVLQHLGSSGVGPARARP